MGLISNIRKHLWFVTILIALALIGFIVMDMTTGKGAIFNNTDTLGKVAGEKINYKDFLQTEKVLYNNTDVDYFGRKEYLWNQYVERILLNKEADNNGTGVSEPELKELEFGNFLSPVIQRNFRNPSTGVVNREQLNQFKNGLENESLPAQLTEFWKVQEKEIIKDRMYTKLNNIVSKSLHMPNFMVERNQVESNTKYTLIASRVPYTAMKDDEVEVKDEDYKSYIDANPGLYKNDEESRTLKYAVIPVEATYQDSANIRKILEDKIASFRDSKDDSLFVVTNLGKWEETYITPEKISKGLGQEIYNKNVGDVYGPYVDEGEFRLAKVLGKKVLADSVKSRHILRRVSTQAEFIAATNLLDSLKNLIETGKQSFDSLAILYSQDPGSGTKGGDLGFAGENMMVKPFNDVIFYKGDKGKLYVVHTDFGVHLVQITDQKFLTNRQGIKLGIISETIQPGDDILNAKLEEAQTLVQNNKTLESLEKALSAEGKYTIELVGNAYENTFKINKLGENANNIAREFIRWSYGKDVAPGEVCPEVYSLQDDVKKFTNRYLIGGLSSINPKGLMTVDAARNFITSDVMNKKKFEKMKSKVGVVSDINGYIGEYHVEIDTLTEITLQGAMLPQFGEEPELLAKIGKLPIGQVSEPLEGKNGLYVFKVIDKKEAGPINNLDAFRRFYKHPAVNTAMTYMMIALKKKYSISDNRFKFY